jgi:hypothetical protein
MQPSLSPQSRRFPLSYRPPRVTETSFPGFLNTNTPNRFCALRFPQESSLRIFILAPLSGAMSKTAPMKRGKMPAFILPHILAGARATRGKWGGILPDWNRHPERTTHSLAVGSIFIRARWRPRPGRNSFLARFASTSAPERGLAAEPYLYLLCCFVDINADKGRGYSFISTEHVNVRSPKPESWQWQPAPTPTPPLTPTTPTQTHLPINVSKITTPK